jgi:hypothetical protein
MGNARYTGHCFCGAVTIEVTGEPAVSCYCHCKDCRGWLAAPIHGATLWKTGDVRVVEGAERLGTYKKTERSHRHFCTRCGGGVMVKHPAIDMIDVMSVVIPEYPFRPTMHVNYESKVLSMRDGLPKYTDFPSDLGGSGQTLPD